MNYTLRWRHNERDSVSNHQPHDCLLNRLFRRRSKKTSKLRVTGLCVGNSPGTGEFPAQMASYAENVSIWWRHHEWRHMRIMASQTTSLTGLHVQQHVPSYPKPTSLALGDHRWPVDSLHRRPVLLKAFPYHGVAMDTESHRRRMAFHWISHSRWVHFLANEFKPYTSLSWLSRQPVRDVLFVTSFSLIYPYNIGQKQKGRLKTDHGLNVYAVVLFWLWYQMNGTSNDNINSPQPKQWRHMGVVASQIIDKPTACLAVCSG